MKLVRFTLVLLYVMLGACSTSDDFNEISDPDDDQEVQSRFKLLALGDSYTIGQSVCDTCKFPVQLVVQLTEVYRPVSDFELKVIARTGWTTSDLIDAIDEESISNNYDLVTLLIGVNNQFQGKPFSLYESEFPSLLQTAIQSVNGDSNKVIVLSIPDYGFTPFGQNYDTEKISEEIDAYNAFAESYSNSQGVTFVNITDITRNGLDYPELVASDDLHPSEQAYSQFVDRILPLALEKL